MLEEKPGKMTLFSYFVSLRVSFPFFLFKFLMRVAGDDKESKKGGKRKFLLINATSLALYAIIKLNISDTRGNTYKFS